jgi:hypothetical protein
MADAYVYCFTALDQVTGERISSQRRGTLESVKGLGDPIMESQIVVDTCELDHHGFLVSDVAKGAHPIDDLTREIRSLELRADSRDRAALQMNDGAEGEAKYMLRLESRELRNQARLLNPQRTELLADEKNENTDTGFTAFGADPATG